MSARRGIALWFALLALGPGALSITGADPARARATVNDAAPDVASDAALIGQSEQILLVESTDWNQAKAQLQRFARPRSGAPFARVGAPFPAWVGRAGMAWRSDRPIAGAITGAIAGPGTVPGPHKQEGDGRSPAGVFSLGDLWGYAATAPAAVRLPYHAIADSDRCVDDPDSPDYNQLRQAPSGAAAPWRSAEQLRMTTDHYKLLVTVDYNHLLSPSGSGSRLRPQPRAGSCIFLHIAPPPGAGTAGCTALAEADLRQILAWLDPQKRPLLILLPITSRRIAQQRWQLPPELFAP